jgi:hypothetical protein
MSLSRLERCCWVLGAVLLLLLLLLSIWQPALVAAATLPAAVAIINLTLGCLLLAMVVPLMKGAWQPLLLRGLGLGAKGVPLIVPLLLPVLLGVRLIYPWANQLESGFRGVWLSPLGFCLRSLMYAAVWWAIQRRVGRDARGFPAGLIMHVLVASLAAVDWLMSLQPSFFSSLFGLLQIARQLLDGLAFAGLIALLTQAGLRLDILRGLLVVGLAFWLYLHAVHYLIIASVNLPNEAQWYLLRQGGEWAVVTILLMSAQVFCLLWLASPWGLRRNALLAVCGLVLLLGAVEALWMSLPSLPAMTGFAPLAMALLAQVAYAAIMGSWLLRAWRREIAGGAHG